MSEVFKKPKNTSFLNSKYIEDLLLVPLSKDLQEDEAICEFCEGTGIIKYSDAYGLKADPNTTCGMFPYKHESLGFCPKCYNGVVKKCKYCGKILPKSHFECNCEKATKEKTEKAKETRQIKLDEAKELTTEEIDKLVYFYSDELAGFEDGYFSDWDSFFEAYNEAQYFSEEFKEPIYIKDNRPQYVWATTGSDFLINAFDMIDSYAEDWYEDAIDSISTKDLDNLQKYLDAWCKSYGPGPMYTPDYRHKIKIPWENYDENS